MKKRLLFQFLLAAFCGVIAAQTPANDALKSKLNPNTDAKNQQMPAPASAPASPPVKQKNQPSSGAAKTSGSQGTAKPVPAATEPVPVPQSPVPNPEKQPSESAGAAAKRQLIADGFVVCMTHPDFGKIYCKEATGEYRYIDEDGIAIPIDKKMITPEPITDKPTKMTKGESSTKSKPMSTPTPKMSTQLMAPDQLTSRTYVGDIDGNGIDDLLRCNGKELTVTVPDPGFSLVLRHTFAAEITRLIVGDFTTGGREHGKKQIVALLSDGTSQAFAISDDKRSLWWWFTQNTFIGPDERYVVANFDKDIAEEILVHNPTTGQLRFYKHQDNGGFRDMTNFELGNLTGVSLVNVEILVGAFSSDHPERKDLLILDHANGQMKMYGSVMLDNGNLSFWWGFNTRGNLFPAGSQICVANLDGGTRDGILVRNGNNYAMYKVEFGDGNLVRETGVNNGQLPVKPGEWRVVAAKVRDMSVRNESGSAPLRDDLLLIDLSSNAFTRMDARFNGPIPIYSWVCDNLLIEN